MLTLSLLRHAKSSWEEADLEDFERPLARRGESAAHRMGGYMAEHGIAPKLVLCSSAVRARQTLDLVLPRLSAAPSVVYEETFYLAAPLVMLARLHKVDDTVDHVMIVGHDPGLQLLAIELSGKGDPQVLQAVARKYPTGALAVIRFEVRTWSKVTRGTGRLDLLMTPKMLD
jgi:phosphohistidine phosphatase